MIHILDEIHLPPAQLPAVLHALERGYLPYCGGRGVQLQQRWVSPPVHIDGVYTRLWLLWQVADIAGYYAMRLGQDAGVVAFWQQVDSVCTHRERHVLSDATQPLPAPVAMTPEVAHAA